MDRGQGYRRGKVTKVDKRAGGGKNRAREGGGGSREQAKRSGALHRVELVDLLAERIKK